MKLYRSKEEIIKSILEACPNGKTRLMMKTNMEYRRLTPYLDQLLSQGLITYEKKNLSNLHHNGKYQITNLGIRYLEMINQLLVLAK